jgi:membrane protease YdiL (CAAX protease family)
LLEPPSGGWAGFVRREWAYLVCVSFAVLTLFAAMFVDADEVGDPFEDRPGQAAAERRKMREWRERIERGAVPPAYVVLLFAAGAAVLCSYVVLIGSVAREAPLFPGPGARRARWNEWDVIKTVSAFFLLLTALSVLQAGGRAAVELLRESVERSEPMAALVGFLDALSTMNVRNYLAIFSVSSLLTVFVVLEMVRLRGQQPRRALGLTFRGALPPIGAGLVVFFACVPLFLAAAQGWQWVVQSVAGRDFEGTQRVVRKLALATSPWTVFHVGMAAIVVAPICEELFFRGLLYGALRRRVRPGVAILAVGVVFGLFHLPAVSTVVPLAVLGAVLCYIYERTGRLVVPIVIHGLFNLFQLSFLLISKLSS